ncbi:MAG: TolC family protein [Muribaculaceae bacterium]|nr:TolC family protein [Muribaculaceae bacterium]
MRLKSLFLGCLLVLFLVLPTTQAHAQRVLTLDECRALALDNNKQMQVSRVQQSIAENQRKSARTKYLPRVSALGAYEYTSRGISLLNKDQKALLSNLGGVFTTAIEHEVAKLPLDPAKLQELSEMAAPYVSAAQGTVNHLGESLNDALQANNHNTFAGSIILTQPLYMGGAISTLNRVADLKEELAANTLEARRQSTLYEIDNIYWQVVSLRHKQSLAESYLDLVKKLDRDVEKMTEAGLTTRGDKLSVQVRVNEAEMALAKVIDGLSLTKMLLCQLCGLPLEEPIELADERADEIAAPAALPTAVGIDNRPELRLLQNAIDLTHQEVNLLKAENRPQVSLMGGYAVTNPNAFNGFQHRFGGFWHVGLQVRIPIWNWGDVKYKVQAAKDATRVANLELEDTREKIELQVSQNRFRVSEANKNLALAKSNIASAEENLRMAKRGFEEGVVTPTTVMEAQSAWLMAHTQKIDAEIELQLSHTDLLKSLGILQ